MTELTLVGVWHGKPTVFFFNGRGGYSDVRLVSLDEAMTAFDDYVAWVAAGNGGKNDDADPKWRQIAIEAHRVATDALACLEADLT